MLAHYSLSIVKCCRLVQIWSDGFAAAAFEPPNSRDRIGAEESGPRDEKNRGSSSSGSGLPFAVVGGARGDWVEALGSRRRSGDSGLGARRVRRTGRRLGRRLRTAQLRHSPQVPDRTHDRGGRSLRLRQRRLSGHLPGQRRRDSGARKDGAPVLQPPLPEPGERDLPRRDARGRRPGKGLFHGGGGRGLRQRRLAGPLRGGSQSELSCTATTATEPSPT